MSGRAAWLGLGIAAAVAAGMWAYAPALEGPFLSDDHAYVAQNAYVQQLTPERFAALWDPRGEPARITANWAPVHLLGHAAAWGVFGPDVRGHHALNVALHLVASLALLGVLRAAGVAGAAAGAGAAFFLLHPANVEAVAWISQLKTAGSTALALAALLAWRRLPMLGTGLFAAALLTKVSAAFALPIALAWAWSEPRSAPGRRRRGLEAGVWIALAVAVALPQAFVQRAGGLEGIPADPDPLVRLRTSVALLGRYAAMAATGTGTSTFHQPPPPASWLDPWWALGLVTLAGVGTRAVVALRRRRLEAGFWAAAAVAFLPVAQLGGFVFSFPMGDRYLHAILPGLIGGTLLATSPLRARAVAAACARLPERAAALALVLPIAGVLVFFAARSHERAAVWRSGAAMMADAARHYPHGAQAELLRAARAARDEDPATAASALRRAAAQGFSAFWSIRDDPHFAPLLRQDRELRDALADLARAFAARASAVPDPPGTLLVRIAEAHELAGDRPAALAALHRAVSAGGPAAAVAREQLARLSGEPESRAPETPTP